MKEYSLPLGLSFDDILLCPGYSGFSRSEIDLTTQLTKRITLKTPFVSSPMDTVTESKLAITLAQQGGIGIIHRNLSIPDQVSEVKKVLEKNLLVGAAIGSNTGFESRVQALVNIGTPVIVVDSAHGNTKSVIDTIKYIKINFQKIQVIGGNVATKEGAKNLIKVGVDGLRVGMGPGAICTTRIISGMGIPQLSAIMETASIAQEANVPIIADGGIKYSGDIVKALAAGASTVMMGNFFAGALEAPGGTISFKPEQVPARFKNILKKNLTSYTFKEYRAMGSIGAMKEGARIKSEDEFHGKSYKDRIMIAEGVESLIPLKGAVKDIVEQAIGGIRSGMYYLGVKNIKELYKNSQYIKITQASLTESHPHDILITNSGENY